MNNKKQSKKNKLRITVLCHNTPYPANHGGKLDMWNSLKMFANEGVHLQLISWDDKDQNKETISAISDVCESHQLIRFSRNLFFRLRRVHMLFLYPWFALIRWPSNSQLKTITEITKEFDPDVILLHGWHGALLSFYLKDKLNKPLLYRSQNIEYLYIKNQGTFSRGIRNKVVNLISQINMKKFEQNIIKRSEKSYYISKDDFIYFYESGCENGEIIFPFIDTKQKITINNKPIFDLSFIGNLHTPNNINGIIWLLNEVMPMVWEYDNTISLVISGSNPAKAVVDTIQKYKQVTLVKNPVNSSEALSAGRVYLNPVVSAGGIQLKNIEMALHGRAVIARSQGLSGLPDEVRDLFTIADSPEEFSKSILEEIKNEPKNKYNKEIIDTFFGSASVQKIMSDIIHLGKRD